MNTKKNSTLIIFLLVAAVYLSFLTACSQDQEQYIPEPPTVLVRAPHSIAGHPTLSVSGTLQAAVTVHLAFQVAGQIQEISVSEGDSIKKGQQLAHLDAKTLQNNLAIAEAKLNEVSKKHERLAILYKRGSLTITDMDKIDAALTENRAATKTIRQRLSDSILLAPMDGIIAKKNAEPGSVVSPGLPILDMVQVDHIKAVLSIPESDVSSIQTGQQVSLRLPSHQDHIIKTSIHELLPVANSLTRSYEAVCKLNNDKRLLHPGSIVLATISLIGNSEILTIPGESVLVSPDADKYVFVLTENQNSVRRKLIATKGFLETEVVVTHGISKNDLVVIAGQKRLSDGAMVKIKQDTKAK